MSRHHFRWPIAMGLGFLLAHAACGDGDSDVEGDDRLLGGGGGASGSANMPSGAGGMSPTGGGSSGGGGRGGAQAMPTPDAGSPECDTVTPGVLAEELPDPDASLAGVSFSGDIAAFVDAALSRRFPFGLELVRGGRASELIDDCSVFFGEPASSAEDVYASMEVIVHECGHLHDNTLSFGNTNVYELHADLRFECERGDTTSRGGDTFARSRIAGDSFQDSRLPCSVGGTLGCDSYAPVYLDGNPDDSVFDGGDQGFNMLMEEAVQYVNSIATAWAFSDRKPQNTAVSARDGILTFLWYIERYLRMARTEFPDAYERITGDDCWRDLTLSVWARGERYLELTRSDGSLGIDDGALELLVNDPELLDEIERLRGFADCP